MNYILGLVGHPDINSDVKKIIHGHFNNIEVTGIDVADDGDLNSIRMSTESFERRYSGLLFTAEDVYHLFYSRMKLSISIAYLEDYKTELLKTLFRAGNSSNADVKNISIDTVGYDEIKELYDEIGLSDGDDCQILTVPVKIANDELVDKVTRAHLENHEKFGSTCITFFTETRNRLQAAGVPVLKVGINKDEIIKRVNELISRKHSRTDSSGTRIATLIMLSGLKEHIVIEHSEFNFVTEYNRISEAVYWFSEKIDGAYIPNDQRKYIIFSDREKFEQETDYCSNIKVLNEVAAKNYFTCSIGIGYGRTDREAVKHATLAQIKASAENRNAAYVMYENNRIAGPVLPSTEKSGGPDSIYDIRLNEIAVKSGISISTIYKFYNIINRTGETEFTSRDMSDHLGLSIRSVNRLYQKLLKSGFIRIVGEKSNGEKGRPIRVYRFIL